MAEHPTSILELAKKGAIHRYRELKAELADAQKARWARQKGKK